MNKITIVAGSRTVTITDANGTPVSLKVSRGAMRVIAAALLMEPATKEASLHAAVLSLLPVDRKGTARG